MDQNLPENISNTPIPGVFLIKRPTFPDDRGMFQEIVRFPDLEKAVGHEITIRQINKSVNLPNVLRGIHVAPWAKLIHCYEGEIYQVVVDARKDSPTFSEVFSVQIGESNPTTLWLPPFCGNGFCVLGDKPAIYSYCVTEVYQPNREIEIAWDDPDLAPKINWPIKNPLVSERDKQGKYLKDLDE